MTRILAFLRVAVNDGVDLAYLAGVALLTVAGWLVAAPLGIAVLGGFCLLTALLLAVRGHTRPQ